MQFDVITIFPEIFNSYLKEALISRALEKKMIKFKAHNLRDWAEDKRKTIDDRPFGGGLGMVIKAEPVFKAVIDIKKKNLESKTILLTPRGQKFNQKKAYQYSKLGQLIIICGRYEGVDERVAKHLADEEVSLGDYILMGGELPALTIFEATARLVPGVIGKKETFLAEKTIKDKKKIEGMVEVPQYTRPETFVLKDVLKKRVPDIKLKKKKTSQVLCSRWRVPKDLISGDHRKIEAWRKKHGRTIWN
jgi:tRNA (guanine37-N1)-methyltransferase